MNALVDIPTPKPYIGNDYLEQHLLYTYLLMSRKHTYLGPFYLRTYAHT